MPLTKGQEEELMRMTSEGELPVTINRWLVGDCGLSFKEASLLRRRAVSACWNDKGDYEARAFLVAKGRKRETTRRKCSTSILHKAAYEATFDSPMPKREPEKPSCVTCQSTSFDCPCPVKTVEAIPF